MWAFILLAIVIIGAVAATSWWLVTTRLAEQERTAVYDIEEAADFVAQGLPTAVNTRLDRDKVQRILGLHLLFMRSIGLATYGGVDDLAMDAASAGETVVADEDEAVDFVYRQLDRLGDPTEMVDVVVVIDMSNRYLREIGALGPSIHLD